MKDEKLVPIVVELTTLMADYQIDYQKLRSNHWNILGQNFFDLHNKFEEMYNDAKVKIDEIAERILTLRFHPMSTFKDYFKVSAITEKEDLKTDVDMVKETLNDHKILLKQMSAVIEKAEAVSDEGTIDLIGAYIRELEKTSWMLNAWTKDTKDSLNKTPVEA